MKRLKFSINSSNMLSIKMSSVSKVLTNSKMKSKSPKKSNLSPIKSQGKKKNSAKNPVPKVEIQKDLQGEVAANKISGKEIDFSEKNIDKNQKNTEEIRGEISSHTSIGTSNEKTEIDDKLLDQNAKDYKNDLQQPEKIAFLNQEKCEIAEIKSQKFEIPSNSAENQELNEKIETHNEKSLEFSEKFDEEAKIPEEFLSKELNSPVKHSNLTQSKRLKNKIGIRKGLSSCIDEIFPEVKVKTVSKSVEKAKKNRSLSQPSISLAAFKRRLSVQEASKNFKVFTKSEKNLIYSELKKIAEEPPKDISILASDTKKEVPSRTSQEIDSDLYQDAVRRASIQHIPVQYPEIFTSLKSLKIIIQKFIKDFLNGFEKLNISSRKIDFEAFVILLKSLNFIKKKSDIVESASENEKIQKYWDVVSKEAIVFADRFIAAGLSVLGIYPSRVLFEMNLVLPCFLSKNSIQNSFTYEEEIKIHKNFLSFYENRHILKRPSRETKPKSFTFSPALSNNTEEMIKNNKLNTSNKNPDVNPIWSQKRFEKIINEKKIKEENNKKAKIEKELEELKFCTFKPTVLNNTKYLKNFESDEHRTFTLYKKSLKINKDQSKTVTEEVIQKDLGECTFIPNLKKSKFKEETNGLYSLSVQKNILRLQKAREEETRKKIILSGYNPAKFWIYQGEIEERAKSVTKGSPLRGRSNQSPEVPRSNLNSLNFEKSKIENNSIEEIKEHEEENS